MRTLTKEIQSKISPKLAINILKEGNKRFVTNLKLHRNLLEQVNETSKDQYPIAIILSCIDSRTSAELIFDQGLGDIFSVRVAGNIVNEDILGSMEFACGVAGSKLIVVLGHTNCGAIKGACDDVKLGNLTKLIEKIKPSIEMSNFEGEKNSANQKYVEDVANINVHRMVEQIEEKSPILKKMKNEGKIDIVGAMYSVDNGKVKFL